jgi:hypothetical protein
VVFRAVFLPAGTELVCGGIVAGRERKESRKEWRGVVDLLAETGRGRDSLAE